MPAACYNENVRSRELGSVVLTEPQAHSASIRLDAYDRCLQMEFDALAFQDRLQRLGHVAILMPGDVFAGLDNGHLAPHAPIELRHFQSDRAGADDREMLRKAR